MNLSTGHGERILLVDDDAGVRDVVAFTLRREGYEVDEERDGPSALESGRTGRYSLVVLDVMLPGLSGVEVCRDAAGRVSDVPITDVDGEGRRGPTACSGSSSAPTTT